MERENNREVFDIGDVLYSGHKKVNFNNNFNLTEEQEKIYNNVVKTNGVRNDNIFVIKGFAGTGKTVIACSLVKSGEFSTILVVAPTLTALSVIKKKIGPYYTSYGNLEYSSLSKLIKQAVNIIKTKNGNGLSWVVDAVEIVKFKDFLQKIKCWREDLVITTETTTVDAKGEEITTFDYIVNIEAINSLTKAKLNMEFEIETEFRLLEESAVSLLSKRSKPYDLIIVDESSMVDSQEFELLNTVLKNRHPKTKICWFGDEGQLPPVNGKLSNTFIVDNENKLSKVLRSNDSVITKATVVRKLGIESLNNVEKVEDLEQFIFKNSDRLLNYDICLTHQNKHVNTINRVLRAVVTSTRVITPGEPVVIDQNCGYLKGHYLFNNSERAIISKVMTKEETSDYIRDRYEELGLDDWEKDPRLMHLQRLIDDNILRSVELKMEGIGEIRGAFMSINAHNHKVSAFDRQICRTIAKLFENEEHSLTYIEWKLAYAMTVHKSQGSEWDNVCYFYSSNRYKGKDTDLIDYTAITRAKLNVDVIRFKDVKG